MKAIEVANWFGGDALLKRFTRHDSEGAAYDDGGEQMHLPRYLHDDDRARKCV